MKSTAIFLLEVSIGALVAGAVLVTCNLIF